MDNSDHFGYKVRAHLGGIIEILICGSIEDMGTIGDHSHTHSVVKNKPCEHRSGVEPSRNDASIPVAFQSLKEKTEDREKSQYASAIRHSKLEDVLAPWLRHGKTESQATEHGFHFA